MKGKRFQSIQDIESTTTAQLETLTKGLPELLQTVARNDGISMFEGRGSILREINGHVSFTAIHAFI
jgi:hypothetical protein